MIVRAGTGWQYALADLSLILFLATATALAQAQGHAGEGAKTPPVPPARPLPIAAAMEAEPVAVWSAGTGAPPLAQWLDQNAGDARLEVRIVVRFADGMRDAAVAQAVQLARAGGPRAGHARLLVEPGTQAGASVLLFYASEAAALTRIVPQGASPAPPSQRGPPLLAR